MVGTRKIGSRVPLLPDELSVPDILKVDKEKAVTTYFQKLVDLMSVEAAEQNAHYAQSEQNDKSVPSAEYNLVDHQTSEVAGGRKHKMDLVFYNPVASDGVANVHIIVEAKKAEFKNKIDVKTFSQIADYQYSVWKVQPTRTFVPVLLPNGPKLDLVVFARESWYRVEVGYLCHWLATINNHNIEKVRSTMAQLYFLITLPSERFGHFCKASLGWEYVTFVRGPNRDSTIALVESSHSPTTNSVKLSGYIERFVHPRGRLAHVFRTTFRKQKAILKLSWTPVGRMPEGAVYELLENANVKGMPRVFGRGLVCTSLFGYRLEYLVLEDCGSTIHEYLQVGRQGGLSSGSLNNRVTGIVWQTLQCLVQARVKANVLHRDISAGNIMIDSDGVVRIIDWGYAKVIDDASFDINERATRDRRALLDATANRWRYVSAKVQQNEDAHDPLTGTPLYMSIPVLAGAKERGLADDVESLFYVILHVLTKLQATPDSAACAFDQYDN
ncbi:Suppressor of Sensor Kinase (SLN1), partial [Coemansia sp. IMI 209128]